MGLSGGGLEWRRDKAEAGRSEDGTKWRRDRRRDGVEVV